MNKEPAWDENGIYLQVMVKGYLNSYGTTQPAIEAISILKTFFGICLSLHIFKRRYVYSSFLPLNAFYAHRGVHNNGWVIDNKISIDEGLGSIMSQIYFEDLPGSDENPIRKNQYFAINLAYISSVLDHREADGERIATACQWLFESYYGDNELLNFIQATVVLEILLGDKSASDEIGLGELLRSRCAYLIGKTRQQRGEILQDFKEIYQVRSKIVHQGKRHLSSNERRLFFLLVWMGQRVIQEEAKLLSKDADKGKPAE